MRLLVLLLAAGGCDRVFQLHRDIDAPTTPPDADVSCAADIDCGEMGTCSCGQCSYTDPLCGVTNLRWSPDALGSLSGTCVPAIEKIATRVYHTCATMTDGTAWCWGKNDNGQLGTGQMVPISSTVPVQLRSSAGVITELVEVRPGALSTCARKKDGTVVCWGSSLFGELGGSVPSGPDMRSLEPVPVVRAGAPLTHVTALSMGFFHGCALVAPPAGAEEIWCWGVNSYGQLGAGTAMPIVGAVKVLGLPAGDILQVAAGGDHTCAIVQTGGGQTRTAYCWGRQENGRLGNNTVVAGMQLMPTAVLWQRSTIVEPMPDVASLAIGSRYTCAIKNPPGEFFCWGLNTNGALGDNTVIQKGLATEVRGIADGERTLLAADDLHSCGMRATTLYCWGRDDNGEVGNGATIGDQLMPVLVIPSLGQHELALGWNFSCALDTTRQLRCWGANVNGELGIGGTADQPAPVMVPKSAFCPAP